MGDLSVVVEWASKAGMLGLLALFIVGLLREDIVLGRTYRRDLQAKDAQIAFLQRISLRSSEHTDRVIGMVEQINS